MSKARTKGEGSIRLHKDGRYEVRVTVGHDFATGEPKRTSKYARTEEEAVRILHELSYINDTTPKNLKKITLSEWLNALMYTCETLLNRAHTIVVSAT